MDSVYSHGSLYIIQYSPSPPLLRNLQKTITRVPLSHSVNPLSTITSPFNRLSPTTGPSGGRSDDPRTVHFYC